MWLHLERHFQLGLNGLRDVSDGVDLRVPDLVAYTQCILGRNCPKNVEDAPRKPTSGVLSLQAVVLSPFEVYSTVKVMSQQIQQQSSVHLETVRDMGS
jgi:hypothetical protein